MWVDILNWLLIAALVSALAWFAYYVGKVNERKLAWHTIANLRRQIQGLTRERDELREKQQQLIRLVNVQQKVQEPKWMQ